MTSKLGVSQRDRRTLTFGGVTIIVLVAIARGLPALRSWEEARLSEAQHAAQQVASVRLGSQMLPALRDSVRARRARLAALDTALLAATSPSGIAAQLASTLEEIADDNAFKITALQLRADSVPVAGLVRAEVRVTAVTGVEGLAGFLRDVESGATPLAIRDLTVSQPEPTAPDSKAEMLRVDVLVAGLGSVRAAKSEAGR